jgi:uncharacterized protein (TIGR00251 family)
MPSSVVDPDEIPGKRSATGLVINVRVEPRSSTAAVVGVMNDILKVKLTAPPVGGAANEQLIRLLADHFGVRKSDIRIVRGHTRKNKVVEIRYPL